MAAKSSDWRPGPTVCRCCFAEGCYKDISTEYFWMGKREVYAEMLTETFDVAISYMKTGGPNSNSRLICEPCISRLRDASDFKRQVVECEKVFTQTLASPEAMVSETEVLIQRLAEKDDIKLERVKVETKVDEDDDFDDRGAFPDDNDDDLDDEPLTKFATKVPKDETVDILDFLETTKPKKPLKRKSSSKVKSAPSKKTKSKEPQPSASKSTAPVEKKKKGTEKVCTLKKEKKFMDQRDNAAINIENSSAIPFRWSRSKFNCAYCPNTYEHFAELKKHNSDHPKQFKCLPRLKFPRELIKIEVSNLRCELCFTNNKHIKTYKNINDLIEHLDKIHKKPLNATYSIGVAPFLITEEYFSCYHCNEKFPSFVRMSHHMNQHYPDNVCSQCGKVYATLRKLNRHLLTHEQSLEDKYQCPKCPEKFDTKIKKDYHVKLVHRSKLRYRCPICQEEFKCYGTRVTHMNEVHGKTIKHHCELCTASFATRNRLTNHVKHVHLKDKKHSCNVCSYKCVTSTLLKRHMVRHDSSQKFPCSVCNKCFPREKSLKEHMRIHNNDRRFACQFCSFTSVQKCSLKSHLRTQHGLLENIDEILTVKLEYPV